MTVISSEQTASSLICSSPNVLSTVIFETKILVFEKIESTGKIRFYFVLLAKAFLTTFDILLNHIYMS